MAGRHLHTSCRECTDHTGESMRPRTGVPLTALFVANLLSMTAVAMVYVALPWYVLQTTGSAVRTAVVVAFELAGVAVSLMLSAPMVMRWGARTTAVLSSLAAAAVVVAIPVLHTSSGLPFSQLLVLAALFGLSRGPGMLAAVAWAPEVIVMAGVPLDRAAALDERLSGLANVIGTVTAGVLAAFVGPLTTLTITAATFAVPGLLVGVLVPSVPGLTFAFLGLSYADELRAMLQYLRNGDLSNGFLVVIALAAAIDFSIATVLLPVYANDVLHSVIALGLMGGTFAAGVLAGSLLYDRFGAWLRIGMGMGLLFIIVTAARFGVLAVEPGLTVILVVMALAGLAAGPSMTPPRLVGLAQMPAPQRTLLYGAAQARTVAAGPVLALLVALAVAGFGLTATLWVVGALGLLITLSAAVVDL